jgi:hypothetical protein
MEEVMDIKFEACQKDGIYLFFSDGTSIDFSKERIKALGDDYWSDPEKLPKAVREHEDFKTCSVCPYRGQNVFCSAMKPLLPFLEEMERFESHSTVAAVHVRSGQIRYIPATSMQHALKYVTSMALLEYCEDAKVHYKYFRGIDPFMSTKEAGCRLFMNIFWLHQGDRPKVEETLKEIHHSMLVTAKNCVKRLNLMCKSDVFMNAFILSEGFLAVLSMDPDDLLKEYFDEK